VELTVSPPDGKSRSSDKRRHSRSAIEIMSRQRRGFTRATVPIVHGTGCRLFLLSLLREGKKRRSSKQGATRMNGTAENVAGSSEQTSAVTTLTFFFFPFPRTTHPIHWTYIHTYTRTDTQSCNNNRTGNKYEGSPPLPGLSHICLSVQRQTALFAFF